MAKVLRKRIADLTVTADGAVSHRGKRIPNLTWTADGAVAGLVSDDPKPDARSRSRKARKNRGGGPQRRRARVVLKRMYGEKYPTEDEVSDADLYSRFAAEYDRFEGKAKPASKHGMPSLETVLREVGRKD